MIGVWIIIRVRESGIVVRVGGGGIRGRVRIRVRGNGVRVRDNGIVVKGGGIRVRGGGIVVRGGGIRVRGSRGDRVIL